MSNTDFEEAPDAPEIDEAADDEAPLEGVEGDETQEIDELDAGSDEGGGESEGEEVAERQPSRAEARIRTLRDELERTRTEAREREDRFQRELSEIRQTQQARSESPEAEAERLALMSSEERSSYKLDRALAKMERDQALASFKMEDQADRMAFQSKAQADKVYAKYAQTVETQRIEFMKQGQVIPREELLAWVVGKEALAARGKTAAREAARGQRNVQRQTTRPVNGRGDTSGERRGTADSPAKRLDGVYI